MKFYAYVYVYIFVYVLKIATKKAEFVYNLIEHRLETTWNKKIQFVIFIWMLQTKFMLWFMKKTDVSFAQAWKRVRLGGGNEGNRAQSAGIVKRVSGGMWVTERLGIAERENDERARKWWTSKELCHACFIPFQPSSPTWNKAMWSIKTYQRIQRRSGLTSLIQDPHIAVLTTPATTAQANVP